VFALHYQRLDDVDKRIDLGFTMLTINTVLYFWNLIWTCVDLGFTVHETLKEKLEERKRQKVIDANNAKLKDVEANNENAKAPQDIEEKSLIDHTSNNKATPQSIAGFNESVKENEIITQKDHIRD